MKDSLFQPKPWLDLFHSYGHSFRPKSPHAPSPSSEQAYVTVNFFALPSEVIHLILSMLEAEQLSTLAQVSTHFLQFVYDPRHWRRIAIHAWPHEPLSQLEKRLHQYKSWRKMCILRPRLRTHAIYTVRYQFTKTSARSATEEPEAPVFLITYYRFLRFYNDGTVVSLTTSELPHHAVKRIRRGGRPGPGERDKGSPSVGRFKFDENSLQIVLYMPMNNPRFPHMRTGTVYMDLTLSSTKPGANDRLILTNHYTILDHEGGELIPYATESRHPFRLIPIWGFCSMVYQEFPRDDDRDLAQWFEMKRAERVRIRQSITR